MHVSGFPSSLFRACIRASVSDRLFWLYSCTALLLFLLIQCTGSCHLRASHLRFIHSCAIFCLTFLLSARLIRHSCAVSYFSFHVSGRLHSFMRCILFLLLCMSQASSIYALHPASFFHVSVRLHLLMRCILSLFSCISQAAFIHATHSASPCMYQPRSLKPP